METNLLASIAALILFGMALLTILAFIVYGGVVNQLGLAKEVRKLRANLRDAEKRVQMERDEYRLLDIKLDGYIVKNEELERDNRKMSKLLHKWRMRGKLPAIVDPKNYKVSVTRRYPN